MDTNSRGRPRPKLFRALGANDPPISIVVDGVTYERAEIFKHDSWAATAIYVNGSKKIVCKFNRQQSILGFPMGWLGRWLARRESNHYRQLADLPNVPCACGPVFVNGVVQPHATAHSFVVGHPLGKGEQVNDTFFPELITLLEELHRRDMAYVDLHKRENIIVGVNGRPYLIDFQVSLLLGPRARFWIPFSGWVLRQLQSADRYHLLKHQVDHRPDLYGDPQAKDRQRTWWIRLHRFFAVPLREGRRRLLVLLGIRKDRGRSATEHFAEDAVRQETEARKAA